MKWPHGCFECSKADVMGIVNIHEVTYGYFEYLWGDVIDILNKEVTLWKYSEADVMGILKFIFKITRLLWIFKIPMTSLQEYSKYQCHYEYSKYPCHIKNTTSFEYSKYPWHHFKNIPKYQWRQLLNIPMTSLCEYSKYNDVTSWIFKMPHLNIESCRHGYFENSWSDVIGLLNTHEVTSWLFMKWPHG